MEGRSKLILTISILFIGGIFLFSDFVDSKNSNIVITEIAAYEKSNCEWVEIYNKSKQEVNIEDWRLWENNVNHTIKPQDIDDQYPTTTQIKSNEYALIADKPSNLLTENNCKTNYNISTSTVVLDSSWSSLREDGEEIALKKSSSFADTVERFKYATTSSVDTSLERVSPKDLDYTEDNWKFLPNDNNTSTPISTPGYRNWHTPASTPNDISTTTPNIKNITASSSIAENVTTSFIANPDDTVSYEWNFEGDKYVQSEKNPSQYKFSKTDMYVINLLGYNQKGAVSVETTSINVTELPQAKITAPTSSTVSSTINFKSTDSTSPVDIKNYWWSFGDGNTSTASNTTHSYNKSDCYDVNLKIEDENRGKSSTTTDIKILSKNQQIDLAAKIEASSSAKVSESVYFDGNNSKSVCNIQSYSWEINGETKVGPTTTYTFSTSSNYNISLTVNTADKSDTATHNIEITSTNTSNSNTTTATSNDKIVINEFLSDPESGNEWIELYNPENFKVNLQDWSLHDGVGKIDTLTSTISNQDFYVLNIDSAKLNNSGDEITLKDASNVKIDEVKYGSWENNDNNAPKPNKDNTTARNNDGEDTDNDKNDFSETTNPTKGGENIIKTETNNENNNEESSNNNNNDSSGDSGSTNNQTFKQSDIVVNELVSDPAEGAVEFVELYNNTADDISLDNWSIEDENGGKTILDGNITSESFHTIEQPKGKLNNSGDTVYLFSPNGKNIDSVTYGSENIATPDKNQSLARKTDGKDSNNNSIDFAITNKITKNSPNIIEQNQTTSKDNNQDDSENQNNTAQQDVDIIINEILPDPEGKDTEGEFIEIKNIDNKKANLNNWILTDGSSKEYEFENQNIKPEEILLLKREETGIALNNSSQEEVSILNSNEDQIDKIEYKSSKKASALARNKIGAMVWTKHPTPGRKNKFKTKGAVGGPPIKKEGVEKETTAKKKKYNLGPAKNLEITEIFPDPQGSDKAEYIEIYNPSENKINLSGFKIDDKKGGSSPYTIDKKTNIKSESYLVFSRKETGIALNNNGDSARILDPSGRVIFELSYNNAKEGSSFTGSYWTNTLTPGSKNVNSGQWQKKYDTKSSNSSRGYIKTTLANIDEYDEGQNVIVKGVTAVKPGKFSSQYFYIVGSPGVQIYNYDQKFPKLKIGDRVEVKGELSKAYGEWRIKIDQKNDIKKIDHPGRPKGEQMEVTKINNDTEGGLISLQGEITETKGNYFYLDDGTAETKVYLKENTGIDDDKFQIGDLVRTKGIISQRSDEYRILPRSPEDIKKTGTVSKKNEQKQPKEIKREEMIEKYLIATAGIIIVILLTLILKQKTNTN